MGGRALGALGEAHDSMHHVYRVQRVRIEQAEGIGLFAQECDPEHIRASKASAQRKDD